MLRSPTISKAFGYPASLVLAVDGSIDLTEPTLGRDAVRRNRRGSENNVGEIRSTCGKTGVGICPMHPGKIRLRAFCRVSDKLGAAYLRNLRQQLVSKSSAICKASMRNGGLVRWPATVSEISTALPKGMYGIGNGGLDRSN